MIHVFPDFDFQSHSFQASFFGPVVGEPNCKGDVVNGRSFLTYLYGAIKQTRATEYDPHGLERFSKAQHGGIAKSPEAENLLAEALRVLKFVHPESDLTEGLDCTSLVSSGVCIRQSVPDDSRDDMKQVFSME